MHANRRRWLGLAGVLGGVGLVAYVLLKQLWVPTAVGMEQFKATTGFSFHFLEVAPMLLLTAGMVGFYALERDPDPGLADAALGLATVGVAVGTFGHAIEHTLFHLGSSAGYAFAATHYLGLGLAGLGLTVYGVRTRPSSSALVGARERALLASTLPVALVVTAVVGTLLFRSYADAYKLHVAVVVAGVGYRLWRPPSDVDADVDAAVADASP